MTHQTQPPKSQVPHTPVVAPKEALKYQAREEEQDDKTIKEELNKGLKQNIASKEGKSAPTFYELGEGSETVPPTQAEITEAVNNEAGK